MLKKIGIVIGIVVLIAVIGFGIMIFRMAGMANKIEAENAKIGGYNLSQVKDGTYVGQAGDFVVSAKVQVTVKNHKIKEVKLLEQKCGPGYEAKDTIDRIIKAQSPKVDAVTGASTSSRSIMNAVDQALKNGQLKK